MGLIEDLRSTGVIVLDSEAILYILSGLNTNFEAIVAVISSQLETMHEFAHGKNATHQLRNS